MSIRSILPAAVLVAAIAAAATGQVTPHQRAKAFTLDGLSDKPVPTTAAEPVSPADSAATTSTIRAVFTLDTPVQDLIADPGAKGVLDKDLPGMSDDENIDKFKTLSLHQLQPQTGGQLTDAMLAKVASDLDKLAGGTAQVAAPLATAPTGPSRRNRDTSR